MVGWLDRPRGGSMLVVRLSPLWLARGVHRRRVDGLGHWWSRSRSGPRVLADPLAGGPAPRRTSGHRCRPVTSGGAVPTPIARTRTHRAGRATANRFGTARRSLPESAGGRSTGDPDVAQLAGPSRSRPTSHRKSHRCAPCRPASAEEAPGVSRHALGDVHLAVVRADGTGRRSLTTAPGVQEVPSWSPDGRRIAFDAFDPAQPVFSTSIWLMRSDGTRRRQVTTGGFDVEPSFAPDGRHLAFARIAEDLPVAAPEAILVADL